MWPRPTPPSVTARRVPGAVRSYSPLRPFRHRGRFGGCVTTRSHTFPLGEVVVVGMCRGEVARSGPDVSDLGWRSDKALGAARAYDHEVGQHASDIGPPSRL